MIIDYIGLLVLASFCSITFGSVTMQSSNATTGQYADLSSVYSVIFNTTPVNCTPFIPPAAYQAMLHLNANESIDGQAINALLIPDGYLHDCLSSIHYYRQLPAYLFLSPYTDTQLAFSMTVSELVGYNFDGTLTLKVNIELQWIEPRLQWDTSESINQFNWPLITVIPVTRLWMPVFEVMNCPLADCRLLPTNSTPVTLENSGNTDLVMSNLIGATCPLNF